MSQATDTPITSRRNFLARALGLTAAGVVAAVPAIATPATPREHIERLKVELAEVLRRLYGPDVQVTVTDNQILPERVREGSIGLITARMNV